MSHRFCRTIVYVDGFNLYYGALRGSPWKWLDPAALFDRLLGPQHQLVKLKYFTARLQPLPANPQVNIRQDAYFRALHAWSLRTELHFGHFLRHRVTMENAMPPPASVEVWKNEEKGSDVNLALHMLNDAWLDEFDCAGVVSNDSDLAQALQLVKAQHHKLIGLVTPGAPKRRPSRQLANHANFTKPIRNWMLRDSQLPDLIPGTTICKPSGW
jgi:uncharacterized LabA/DUF88 family protein